MFERISVTIMCHLLQNPILKEWCIKNRFSRTQFFGKYSASISIFSLEKEFRSSRYSSFYHYKRGNFARNSQQQQLKRLRFNKTERRKQKWLIAIKVWRSTEKMFGQTTILFIPSFSDMCHTYSFITLTRPLLFFQKESKYDYRL